MSSDLNVTYKVLDKGEITLENYCASDLDVVNAARVSFNVQREEMEPGDEKLIDFLLRENHGSPLEHNYFKFRVKAPIMVFREWHRHRIASINEVSGRYVELPTEFYLPLVDEEVPDGENWVRTQQGRPGHYVFVPIDRELALEFTRDLLQGYEVCAGIYRRALDRGIAKEQARLILPVATYSEMIWSCNMRSLLNFLFLRNAPNAQWEIQQYAVVMEDIVSRIMPHTVAAFRKHQSKSKSNLEK